MPFNLDSFEMSIKPITKLYSFSDNPHLPGVLPGPTDLHHNHPGNTAPRQHLQVSHHGTLLGVPRRAIYNQGLSQVSGL